MDIIISLFITFCIFIFSIYKGIFVGYPLILGFLIFSYMAFKKGFLLKDIIRISYHGGKKAFVVLEIFVLIGTITSVWMASGTVPAIVYYGITYMHPDYFLLSIFIISCIVSFLLGTAFGTVSTVGVAFILMAKSGSVHVSMAAGAIMAGAYFGDRCSPMSSSANLVAKLTQTNLYINIRNMFKTAVIPFFLSLILYFILSLKYPLHIIESGMDKEILKIFTINWAVLLPAIIIFVFSIFKVNVKISMFVSILLSCIIAVILQHHKPMEVLQYICFGFHLDKISPLQNILKGGGIFSMYKAAFVVFISCALAGIFDETNMLKGIENILIKVKMRSHLMICTTIVSIITAAFGCNQSISIVLTNQLMKKNYQNKIIDSYQLAMDVENTAVVLAPLIPWNIAALVPTTTLGVSSAKFIPYAFYLYLIPICNILFFTLSNYFTKNKTVHS